MLQLVMNYSIKICSDVDSALKLNECVSVIIFDAERFYYFGVTMKNCNNECKIIYCCHYFLYGILLYRMMYSQEKLLSLV